MNLGHSEYVVRGDANETCDALNRLARAVDPRYSEECADSACTNPEPGSDEDWLNRYQDYCDDTYEGVGSGKPMSLEDFKRYDDPLAVERRRFVRQLHRTALALNASGLCDSGTFERYVAY